ncbi:MAG: hypothetical protein EOP82_21655 [Variovorax sp.]|nr:MAG: hypothetical protein EOP82_21655 [Variovorax sp.]
MATVKKTQFRSRQFHNAPYGNSAHLHFQLKTDSTGAAIGADSTAALGIGDKVVLGPLQEGMRLDDSLMVISTGLTASVTGSLGFEYDDGVDSTEVPQSATYFGTALALATAARLRNATTNAPVVLPKAANLILTIAGAANAKVSQLDIVINGEMTGAR